MGQVPDVRNLAECRDEFQYDMRRFLKGDEDTLHQALRRMRCNPVQNGVINYITSYEGFSLADLVSYDRKHNEANGEDNQDGNPYNAELELRRGRTYPQEDNFAAAQKADEKRTGAFAVVAGDTDADSRGRVWTEPGRQQQSVLSGQRDQLAELEAYGEK